MLWYIQVCVTQFCRKNKICAGTERLFLKCSVMTFISRKVFLHLYKIYHKWKELGEREQKRRTVLYFCLSLKNRKKIVCACVIYSMLHQKS